ncbi:GDSL-type esterase/lipase family protein [Fodinibius sediminis]|uniref:Lysophospholipase L1 n=1 Tax=Fodinibius sediminis TaxID=1214077 RepID=A0A521E993_9BACT|nr:GDSL-type esterase/lipase family protein [Fodinibius sediminis]SMO80479.1 Lysophospholipase L1 [Fodinibius sediminis]
MHCILLKPQSLFGIFLTGVVLLCGLTPEYSYGQTADEKPDYGAYYYHKKTLFEQLPNADEEIILLGDSITDGNEWAELFGNDRLKNRGISGDVTDGVLYRLDEVTESKPAKIFIMIGVNDLARDRSVNYVLSNYEKIVDRIVSDSPGTEIYIQSLLPVNDNYSRFTSHYDKLPEIKAVNDGLKSLCAGKGITYIDLFDDMRTAEDKLNPEYTEDGLHLNGNGYMVWKAELEKFLD